jgi:hypothetical protein
MVTYEYVVFKKQSGDMVAESTSAEYLIEFYAAGGKTTDSPGFANFMCRRGFRFAHAGPIYQDGKVEGYTIWLERASEQYVTNVTLAS